jgi:hypothetical protein
MEYDASHELAASPIEPIPDDYPERGAAESSSIVSARRPISSSVTSPEVSQFDNSPGFSSTECRVRIPQNAGCSEGG